MSKPHECFQEITLFAMFKSLTIHTKSTFISRRISKAMTSSLIIEEKWFPVVKVVGSLSTYFLLMMQKISRLHNHHPSSSCSEVICNLFSYDDVMAFNLVTELISHSRHRYLYQSLSNRHVSNDCIVKSWIYLYDNRLNMIGWCHLAGVATFPL